MYFTTLLDNQLKEIVTYVKEAKPKAAEVAALYDINADAVYVKNVYLATKEEVTQLVADGKEFADHVVTTVQDVAKKVEAIPFPEPAPQPVETAPIEQATPSIPVSQG